MIGGSPRLRWREDGRVRDRARKGKINERRAKRKEVVDASSKAHK